MKKINIYKYARVIADANCGDYVTDGIDIYQYTNHSCPLTHGWYINVYRYIARTNFTKYEFFTTHTADICRRGDTQVLTINNELFVISSNAQYKLKQFHGKTLFPRKDQINLCRQIHLARPEDELPPLMGDVPRGYTQLSVPIRANGEIIIGYSFAAGVFIEFYIKEADGTMFNRREFQCNVEGHVHLTLTDIYFMNASHIERMNKATGEITTLYTIGTISKIQLNSGYISMISQIGETLCKCYNGPPGYAIGNKCKHYDRRLITYDCSKSKIVIDEPHDYNMTGLRHVGVVDGIYVYCSSGLSHDYYAIKPGSPRRKIKSDHVSGMNYTYLAIGDGLLVAPSSDCDMQFCVFGFKWRWDAFMLQTLKIQKQAIIAIITARRLLFGDKNLSMIIARMVMDP